MEYSFPLSKCVKYKNNIVIMTKYRNLRVPCKEMKLELIKDIDLDSTSHTIGKNENLRYLKIINRF